MKNLKERLLESSLEQIDDSNFDKRFKETLKQVREDILAGDETSWNALVRIRRLIKRKALIPQNDIDIALSVGLKNWKGANVQGRTFSEINDFDFSNANTNYLHVYGDLRKSVVNLIHKFDTHGGDISMNKGDVSECKTDGGDINNNEGYVFGCRTGGGNIIMNRGDVSECKTDGGNIETNFRDVCNNKTGGGKIITNEGDVLSNETEGGKIFGNGGNVYNNKTDGGNIEVNGGEVLGNETNGGRNQEYPPLFDFVRRRLGRVFSRKK